MIWLIVYGTVVIIWAVAEIMIYLIKRHRSRRSYFKISIHKLIITSLLWPFTIFYIIFLLCHSKSY